MVISSPSVYIISEIDDKTSQSSIRVAFRNIAYKFGSNTPHQKAENISVVSPPSISSSNRVHLRFLQKFFNYVLLLQYRKFRRIRQGPLPRFALLVSRFMTSLM
jgi:hypothetical protein